MLNFLDKVELFRLLDADLHNELNWPQLEIHLKTWQDMAVYDRIRGSQNLRIAEVGGGDSRILRRLAPSNRCVNIDRFEGADGGPPQPVNIPGVLNILANLGETAHEIAVDSFDIIYSISVIEHVPSSKAAAFFDDMLRILRPGGISLHAIDLYIGSDPDPWQQSRLDIYRGWATDRRIIPIGPVTAKDAIFHSRMASNPDYTMWGWSRYIPSMRDVREENQSVALMFGFRKPE